MPATNTCTVTTVPEGPIGVEGIEKLARGRDKGVVIRGLSHRADPWKPDWALGEGDIPDDNSIHPFITKCTVAVDTNTVTVHNRLRYAYRQGNTVVASNIPLLPFPNTEGCIINRFNFDYWVDDPDTTVHDEEWNVHFSSPDTLKYADTSVFGSGGDITGVDIGDILRQINSLRRVIYTFMVHNARVWDHQVEPSLTWYSIS